MIEIPGRWPEPYRVDVGLQVSSFTGLVFSSPFLVRFFLFFSSALTASRKLDQTGAIYSVSLTV